MKCYVCFTCAFSTIIKDRFEKCPICNSDLSELTGKNSKEFLNLREEDRIIWVENKTNQLISDELKLKKESYLLKKKQESQTNAKLQNMSNFEAKMAHGKAILEEQSRVPKCPTCQSTNISKISGGKRWLTVGLFGAASSNLGKTMQCNNCGYKF